MRAVLIRSALLAGMFLSGTTAAVSAADTAAPPSSFPDLPRGITSFGSATIGDALYVYGGHFGGAHRYSNRSQSDQLLRLKLAPSAKWEVVSRGPRLQGLAMVAHGGHLYRLGGFTAHNKEGEEHDLRSVADFARYNPKTSKWQSLAPLPERRSSHDALVIGNVLYVVGGWQLGEPSHWHKTAWSMDLSEAKPRWKRLPDPPFQRRALALGQLAGKLYVIGGMRKQGGPTTRVDIFRPDKQSWSRGPSLIDPLAKAKRGKGMEGFGAAATTVNQTLYVSTYGGNLQALSPRDKAWCTVRSLDADRFFHRMVQVKDLLLLVGGASMQTGKHLELESVKLQVKRASSAP